mgnify:CR=1 FL=1
MTNKTILAILWVGTILFLACSSSSKWSFQNKIFLTDISPIGIAADGDFLWLSDVAGNQLIKIDTDGNILQEHKSVQRPMHIAIFQSKLYVPEFERDTIRIIDHQDRQNLPLGKPLDAPAAVAVKGNDVAIADFYNHRIVIKQKEQTSIIGKEGHQKGELYYPTDAAWYDSQLYVADAYNNRIQVFDEQGQVLRIIGENDNIQVATGLTVANEQLFVSDFESNRILIYNIKGELLQIISSEALNKPIDIEVVGNIMWVVNHEDGALLQYKLMP